MIRYKINILQELKKVGYPSTRIRREKIMGESMVQKLRTGNTSINLASLEPVCRILNCQIGDLVEWVEVE
ncbi:MAG: helix-turn-helix domain-containing protein [Oscillibacter sp.]|nr:helix-turn-helix domain-containing protein [Oscillibacter sp.]MBD5169733.1 helix-turn-helix domain-containing protein [Oscillibacter sp.]